MRGTENPENVVRLHEAPLENSGVLQWQRGRTVNPLSDDFVGSSPTSRTQLALWYNGSTTGFGPVSEGSIPSGVYMEFVAQLVECQIVALVVVGSIPIKLPNASIAQW